MLTFLYSCILLEIIASHTHQGPIASWTLIFVLGYGCIYSFRKNSTRYHKISLLLSAGIFLVVCVFLADYCTRLFFDFPLHQDISPRYKKYSLANARYLLYLLLAVLYYVNPKTLYDNLVSTIKFFQLQFTVPSINPTPINKKDALTCLCLFFFAVIWHLVTAEYVEAGGDAYGKWYTIKQFITEGIIPGWTHHTLRWAINLPVVLIQQIFGTHPAVYYIWPIFSASFVPPVTYLITREILQEKKAMLCIAILVALYPLWIRMGSQFLPLGPMVAYTLTGLLFVLIWQRRQEKKFLLLSGLFIFIGYGAKITSLFYAPPVFLFIYFSCREKKYPWYSIRSLSTSCLASLLAFSAPILLGLLAEALLVWQLTGYFAIRPFYSRMLMMGNVDTVEISYRTFSSTTEYIFSLFNHSQTTLHLGLGTALFFLTRKSKQLLLLSLCYIIALVLMKYTIISLDPLMVFQAKGRLRYYLMELTLGFILIFLLPLTPARYNKLHSSSYVLWIVLCIFPLALTYINGNNIIYTIKNNMLINQAYKDNTPIAIQIDNECTGDIDISNEIFFGRYNSLYGKKDFINNNWKSELFCNKNDLFIFTSKTLPEEKQEILIGLMQEKNNTVRFVYKEFDPKAALRVMIQ